MAVNQALLKEIETILSIEEVKVNKILFEMFQNTYCKIQKNELGALARLSHATSLYLVTNQYEAPKIVDDFAGKNRRIFTSRTWERLFLENVGHESIGVEINNKVDIVEMAILWEVVRKRLYSVC